MLEFLNGIDQAMFLFINVYLANPVTDIIMPVITSDMLLRVMYGAGVAILLWRGDQRLRWLVLFSAMALLLTDQLSGNLLKELIARPRPCHKLIQIHLLVDCGVGFSMPSSHAANLFGQAALFSYHVRAARWYLILFASLVALSRIFVGVHYPFDVLAGGMLGFLVGGVTAMAFKRLEGWKLTPKLIQK
jgi:membrane-associated phospholipid phosphatase